MLKQKADSSKDDELDLLGDEDVESFTGSQADLDTIYLLLHHNLSPYVLNHCHLKLQLNRSLLPQVWLYNKKSSPNSRNPWVLGSTSNCSSKWGFSRLLCLRPWSLSETNFNLSKRCLKKWRWTRPSLRPLSLVPVNKLRIWTQPLLRDLSHPYIRMRLWRWTCMIPPPSASSQRWSVSDQHSCQSEEPSRVVLARPKIKCR